MEWFFLDGVAESLANVCGKLEIFRSRVLEDRGFSEDSGINKMMLTISTVVVRRLIPHRKMIKFDTVRISFDYRAR